MPSINRSKSLTISFYTNLAREYERLTNEESPSKEARQKCEEDFEVSAQTVSDALLFLEFPRHKNEKAYTLYDKNICSASTLIFIFKAAKRSDETTDKVIDYLPVRHPFEKFEKSDKTGSKRGRTFPLSQNDIKKWMKDTIPRKRR